MRKGMLWLAGIGMLLLTACGARPTAAGVAPEDALPAEGDVAGWAPQGPVQTFDRETLFSLVNGQADAFFVYGFEAVAVREYEGRVDGADARVRVEVWRLATPADAYGLYTSGIAGDPIRLGGGGDTDPGRRLAFWQHRYYARVFARPAIPDPVLRAFATAVAERLPPGEDPPELVARLPSEGQVDRSLRFFHEELSIQDTLWLGGRNLLALSPETDAVLAEYEIDGRVAQVLLVRYPEAADAEAGLDALQAEPVAGLVAAETHGALLGAVFGEVDAATATDLLAATLASP